ncbi:MAG: oligosaccharide flippase family protein, partial [Ferruginibacter sp.]
SNIIFFLVTRIDYFFVEKFCDEAALSNYVQASKMGQLFILLPTMIASVLFPYSSGMESKEYLHKLQSVCRIITALSIPVSLVVIAGGYWIFPWLFGRDFTQMYTAMIWYLPGFYSLSLVTLLAAYLAGRAMLTTNLLASAIALMIVIAGDILLIPLYGINAAAGVSSAAYLVCLIYLLTVYKNRLGCRYRHFFSFKKADIFLLLNNFKK